MNPLNAASSRSRDWLVNRVRQVVAAGNTRSVVVKWRGNVVAAVPLTTSVASLVPAVLFVPEITAVATIAGLLAGCTVEVVPTTVPT